jgi:secreted trypsin-like serine protease
LDKAVIRNEDVDYICLYGYSHNDSIVNNIPMFTAGWGSTNPSWRDLQFPDSLYYIDANLYPMDTCTYIFPGSQYRYLFNEVTHVCAGHEDPIVKDTCYGDSGAPLMVQLKGQWFIYGEWKIP